MTARQALATGAAALLALSAAWARADAPEPPATAPATSRPATTRPAGRLAELIRTIRGTQNPREAISAYASGCAIDRLSTELHDAHMRRMLLSGLPKLADYPAQVLVRLQPENGTAWGVVGYVHGKSGKLAKALEPTLRAGELAGKDPSILNNAAQLIAWYQGHRDPPKLADATKRRMDRLRQNLGERKPFAQAYARINAGYAKRDAEVAKLTDKLATAEAESEDALEKAKSLDLQLRQLNEKIETRKKTIRRLRGELRQVEAEPSSVNRSLRYANLRGEIHHERSAQDLAEGEANRILVQGRVAVAKMRRKALELRKVQLELERVQAGEKLDFRWDPPAVDGVVTPETTGPLPPAKTTTAPRSPESDAAKRLEMAKLYLDHGLREKGVQILREVIVNHPSTPATKQARAILKEMNLPTSRPAS